MCHYCEYQIPTPASCPSCDFGGIRFGGIGTQRLEAEVRAIFPHDRCLRMDTDTMQRVGSHEQALDRFRSGEVRILLGTQMIAKGLDFPNVTLVGVINADMALHLQDFRSLERTFQLVTQVAGRTGRGPKGGRVIVQTFSPDLYVLRAAAGHDYQAFADQELPRREAMQYPPFAALIRLVVRGPVEGRVREFAESLADRVRAACHEAKAAFRLLGPTIPQINKIRELYRRHCFLLGPHGEVLRKCIRESTATLQPPEQVQWIADVDPQSLV
jgi:primosomal protein N' (replication factor Y)